MPEGSFYILLLVVSQYQGNYYMSSLMEAYTCGQFPHIFLLIALILNTGRLLQYLLM